MFKVSCIQLCSSSNVERNLKDILQLINRAASDGAKLITLPENCFLMAKSAKQVVEFATGNLPFKCIEFIRELAKGLDVNIVIGSIPIKPKGFNAISNRLIYINHEGRIIGHYDKIHLYDAFLSKTEVYKESKTFTAGSKVKAVNTQFGKIGLTICYDLRFAELFIKLLRRNVDIILVPAAFTFTTGQKHWHVLLRARAIETGCFIIAPALCGWHDNGRRTYGHSLIISPEGNILAEGSGEENQHIIAEIDLKEVKLFRNKLGVLNNRVLI